MPYEKIGQGEDYCFACGPKNPIGLHLEFQLADGKFRAHKALASEYQGYSGIVHGGIVTTLLDEAMGGYLYDGAGCDGASGCALSKSCARRRGAFDRGMGGEPPQGVREHARQTFAR